MGLVDKIKSESAKSGANKSKFVYLRDGAKMRVRFLEDMDEGHEFTFHDSFGKNVNVPCQEHFGRDCPYCGDDEFRTRSQYAWSVYDYDSREVKVFMFPVNQCSPVPQLISIYENYGTLTDRDYMISVTGKQQSKTFSVLPMDKEKFRNSKAKPYSEKALLKLLDKAFPCEESEVNDEDDDDYKHSKTKKQKKDVVDSDEDWEEDDVVDYEDMSPKELYNLCKERGIDAKIKKQAKYYINLLEEYDKAQEDWEEEEEDEDDEW